MSLAPVFASLRHRSEMALVPYLTAGYPNVEASLAHMRTVEQAGADALEIGIPFSDPVADGPTIQFAAHQALVNGFRTREFLRALAAQPRRCPRILMTYLNPLLALGDTVFAMLAEAGISALVVPDLPEREARTLSAGASRFDIDVVLLAAPTSTESALRRIGAASRGFVYAVGVVGTTGARAQADPGLPNILARVRATTSLPLVAGFGLSRPEHIAAIASHADGAIVGSRLVEAIRDGEDLGALIRSFKQATGRR